MVMIMWLLSLQQCLSPLKLWVWTCSCRCGFYTTLCDKVCQWLATGQWFSPGTPVSSTNKTDRHDITEILLTVASITINQAKSNLNTKSIMPNMNRNNAWFYIIFICIHMVIDFDLPITFNQYGILSTAKYEFIYYYSAFILISIFQNKNNYVNIFLQNQYFLSLKHQQSCFCNVFF